MRRHSDRPWKAIAALALLLAAGSFLGSVLLFTKASNEADARVSQFCRLEVDSFKDRVKRLKNTKDYIRSPEGQQPQPLNLYIKRISLPQTEREVRNERGRIPKLCLPQLRR